ncbi:glutathione S-transferase family protein [Sphingorhabdus sp. 109]|jgi:glutathione S-transferase|uniref:glutathione S-transferase family protein n=1 Tax=Sphingorhabdus sp. 109 TaxID=2653173 RepID=UPI0012F27320|nr:glutathione S-transferase [Sphingorhabdus sp. 109]VWX56491.1 Glutathione S-transferase GST-6.0 [Sphingorhabdus sp. 109]
MTIIVHHLENSRSQRILWLLEELGLPYEIKRYERDPKTQKAPDSLKAIHPLGKSPMIEDDAEVIIETAVIAEYLVEKAGGKLGAPADKKGARLYNQYLHFAEGSMMPPLYGLLVVGRLGLLGLPARKPVGQMVTDILVWLESELANRDYFAGDQLTAADIMMSFPLEACQSRAGLDRRYPNLMAYLERIHSRPQYQTALEKGGPYAYA